VATPLMAMIYVRAAREQSVRAGFSVSKKLGNAVVRNRVRRRFRAALRPLLPHLKPGHLVIFVARHRCVTATYQQLEADMKSLLRKAHLLQEEV